MAGIAHSDQTLGLIVRDLRNLADRLDEIRKKMRDASLELLVIEGEKGQRNGRTAVQGFVVNGEQSLRRALDEQYLRDIETAKPPAAVKAGKPRKKGGGDRCGVP